MSRPSGRTARFAAAVAVLAVAGPLHAQTSTWTQTGAGPYSWNTPAYWTNGVPNSSSAVANVTANLATNQTINLNTVITLNTLNIGDTNSYNVAGNGGSFLFNAAGAAINNTSGTNTISAGITANTAVVTLTDAAGTLNLTGALAGTYGGGFTFNDSAGVVTGVNAVSTQLGLTAGNVSLLGNATANSSASAGSLSIGVGESAVTVTPGASAAADLVFGSLNARSSGGTVLFRGANLGVDTIASNTPGAANITFTSAPTLIGGGSAGTATVGVIKGGFGDTSATGNGSDFVTYDAAKGVRLLNMASEQTTFAAALSATANARIDLGGTNTSVTGAAGSAVNSLLVTNTGAAATLTVNTAGLASNAGFLFTGTGGVTVGGSGVASNNSAQGDIIIYNNNSGGVTFGSPITNNNSSSTIAFAGPGTTTLNGAVAATSGYLYVNGPGTVVLNAPATLLNGVVIEGGTFKIGVSASTPADLYYVVPGATFDLNGYAGRYTSVDLLTDPTATSGGGSVTNSGAGTPTLSLGNKAGATTATFSGVISGNLNLSKDAGPSEMQTLAGANTYVGTTTVSAGTLQVNAGGTLGNAGNPLVVSNPNTGFPVTLTVGTALTVGSLSGTVTGANPAQINLNGSTTSLTVSQSANTTFGGSFLGTGGLVLSGAGTLTVAGNSSTYTGTTTLGNGTLNVTGTFGGATSAVAVNAAASAGGPAGTLTGTGTVNGTVTVGLGANGGANGLVSPGTVGTAGTLTAGGLALNGSYLFDATGAGVADRLAVTGTATLGANSVLAITDGSGGSAFGPDTQTYTLLTAGTLTPGMPFGTITGMPANYHLVYTYGSNGSVQLAPLSPTPEPAGVLAVAAVGAGLAGVLRRRRRGRGKAHP